jgi:hypothetical protein
LAAIADLIQNKAAKPGLRAGLFHDRSSALIDRTPKFMMALPQTGVVLHDIIGG